MASFGRFGVRRLAVVGAAVVLGSGVASVGLLSAAAPAGAAPSCTGTTTVTCTFSFTGDNQAFTVPSGVTRMTIDARGAQGGGVVPDVMGGLGGEATETIPVVPGAVLEVRVGGMGANYGSGSSGGFNGGGNGQGGFFGGGGGGGASEVEGLIVAGGGGGGANLTSGTGVPAAGGSGGGLAGGDGVDPNGGPSAGKGGTQNGAGAGGTGTVPGLPGDFSTGGNGIAGGGGGFFGGGGGGGSNETSSEGGGGGGSGFTFGGTGMQNGVQAGNGLVTLVYPGPGTGVGAPPPPTSKHQCKRDGWKNFPQFKNQGQCVSFVKAG
jgi:hypothetical protein